MNDFYGVSKSMKDLKRKMEIRKRNEENNPFYIILKLIFTYVFPFYPLLKFGFEFFNSGLLGFFMGMLHVGSTLFLSLLFSQPETLILKGSFFGLIFQSIFLILLFRYKYFFIPFLSIIVILGYLVGYYQIFRDLGQKRKFNI